MSERFDSRNSSCEADITTKTTQEPKSRFVYDLGGRHDLGKDVRDLEGIAEVFIKCQTCGISETVKGAGEGPYGHINAAQVVARQFLLANCPKIKDEVQTRFSILDKSPLLPRALR